MNMGKTSFHQVQLIMLCFLVVISSTAQNEITLTIAVPVPGEVFITQEIIDLFESQYPGTVIEMQRFDRNDYRFTNPVNIESHLVGVEKYVELADVLPIDIFTSENFSFEATRASYFLNLLPYMVHDSDFLPQDYPKAVLNAFQWDNGLWAIPSGMFGRYIIYNTEHFDEKKIEYPRPGWTLHDYEDAARRLTIYDEAGRVAIPGMELSQGGLRWFIYSLMRQADSSWFQVDKDNQIAIKSETLEAILQQLKTLHDEGIIRVVLPGEVTTTDASIVTGISLSVIGQYLDEEPDTQSITTFPNGQTGVEVTGFAVSSGTEHPQLAYELATFLSKIPEVASANTDFSARLLSGETDPITTLRRSGGFDIMPADTFSFMINSFEDAINRADIHYSTYVITALYTSIIDPLSVNEALNELDVLAKAHLEIVNNRAEQVNVTVNPVIDLTDSVMRFGYGTYNPTTSSRLDQLSVSFAQQDSRISRIIIEEYDWNASLDVLTDSYDCFYRPHSTPALDISVVASMESFIVEDTTFHRDDYLATILDRVTFDNELMGMPTVIQPMVIWYDNNSSARVLKPSNGWTYDEFEAFVRSFPSDSKSFQADSVSSNYLIAFILANGGDIISQNDGYFGVTLKSDLLGELNTIRPILDVAKDSFIYEQLGTFGSGDIGRTYNTPVSTGFIGNFGGRFLERIADDDPSRYRAVLLPEGKIYAPLAYNIGVSYISKNTKHSQSCYDWIREVTKHPELVIGLPVTFSQINTMDSAIFGNDVILVAEYLSRMIGNDNVIHLRAPFGSSDVVQFIQTGLLNVVFDAYILNNQDLEQLLTNVSGIMRRFNACVEQNVRAADRISDNGQRNAQAANCIRDIDETIWFLQRSP